MIGWHVNRGWNEAADFFPAAQFRDQFNRPDIVRKILTTLDEDAAINEANSAAKRERATENVRTSLAAGRHHPVALGRWRVFVSEPNLGILGALALGTACDCRARADRRPSRRGGRDQGFRSGRHWRDERHFAAGRRAVTQRQHLRHRRNRRPRQRAGHGGVLWKGAQTAMREEDLRKGKLYALLVGVGTYKDSNIKGLTWAAQDARDMKAALEQQKGKLYRDVDVHLLTEKDATRDAIIDGLEWLKRNVLKGDVGVLFLSGHGATDDRSNYYFVPYDAELDTEAGLFLPKRSKRSPTAKSWRP